MELFGELSLLRRVQGRSLSEVDERIEVEVESGAEGDLLKLRWFDPRNRTR